MGLGVSIFMARDRCVDLCAVFAGRRSHACIAKALAGFAGRRYVDVLSKDCTIYAVSDAVSFWIFNGLALNFTSPCLDAPWDWHVVVGAWPIWGLMHVRDEHGMFVLYDIQKLFIYRAELQRAGQNIPLAAVIAPLELKYQIPRGRITAPFLECLSYVSQSQCSDWMDIIYA